MANFEGRFYLCAMKMSLVLRTDTTGFAIRNGLALTGLLLSMFLPDLRAMELRSGWDKLTPYLFVLLLYGWLIFHNRVLFERLFERGRRREYLFWTAMVVVFSSLNIVLALHFLYNLAWPVPILVKFYVLSLTGFGIYVAYRQLVGQCGTKLHPSPQPSLSLTVIVDGNKCEIHSENIRYIESLQNYVRIHTTKTQLISRATLKQVASELPGHFLRINRSYLVNLQYVDALEGDEVSVGVSKLRVGRTYRQHVNAHFEGKRRQAGSGELSRTENQ